MNLRISYLLKQIRKTMVTAWSHCLSSPMAVCHTASHIFQSAKEIIYTVSFLEEDNNTKGQGPPLTKRNPTC